MLKNIILKCYFQTNRSYYEVMGVNTLFTKKQLRNSFLKKARELHPDHNKDKTAQQQFKIVKQAYETLNDPQKKYLYDNAIRIPPEKMTKMHHQNQTQYSQKYYQNKWYGYKKPDYKDMRDEFYEYKSQMYSQNTNNNYGQLIRLILTFIVALFGYDMIKNIYSNNNYEVSKAKEILQSQPKTKQAKILKSYIDKRSKINIDDRKQQL